MIDFDINLDTTKIFRALDAVSKKAEVFISKLSDVKIDIKDVSIDTKKVQKELESIDEVSIDINSNFDAKDIQNQLNSIKDVDVKATVTGNADELQSQLDNIKDVQIEAKVIGNIQDFDLDDIEIEIITDTSDADKAFNDLQNSINDVNSAVKDFGNVSINTTDINKLADAYDKSSKSASQSIDAQKRALAQMIVSGKAGTKEFQDLENQLKESVKEAKKLEDAFDQIDDNIEIKVEVDSDGFTKQLEGLKGQASGFSDALTGGLVGAFAAGGVAGGVMQGLQMIGGALSAAYENANAFNSALQDLQAKTGATASEMVGLESAAKAAFIGGVGESVADATKVIGEASVLLGDTFSGEELGGFTAKAQALGNLFDKDVNEVLQKATPFIKQFGLSSEEAFNLLAKGLRDGKTPSDDLLDTFAEYSQLASKAGFSAAGFTEILTSGAQEGIFNLDKLADAIKETEIRLEAGDFENAFKDLGSNDLEKNLVAQITAIARAGVDGTKTVHQVLQESTALIAQQADAGNITQSFATKLQVGIAGTPAEDIGTDLFNRIFSAPVDEKAISAEAAKIGQEVANAVGQYNFFDTVQRGFELFFTDTLQDLINGVNTSISFLMNNFKLFTPLFDGLKNAIMPAWEAVKGLFDGIINSGNGLNTFGTIIQVVQTYITNLVDLALLPFRVAFKGLQTVFEFIKEPVQTFIGALIQIGSTIGELIDLFGDAGGATIGFSDIAKVLGDVIGVLIKIALTPFKIFISAISAIITGLSDGIKFVIEKVKEWASSFSGLKKIIEPVKIIIEQLKNGVLGAAKAIGEFLGLTGGKKAPLKKDIDDVKDAVKDVKAPTKEATKEFEGMSGAIKGIGDEAKATIPSLSDLKAQLATMITEGQINTADFDKLLAKTSKLNNDTEKYNKNLKLVDLFLKYFGDNTIEQVAIKPEADLSDWKVDVEGKIWASIFETNFAIPVEAEIKTDFDLSFIEQLQSNTSDDLAKFSEILKGAVWTAEIKTDFDLSFFEQLQSITSGDLAKFSEILKGAFGTVDTKGIDEAKEKFNELSEQIESQYNSQLETLDEALISGAISYEEYAEKLTDIEETKADRLNEARSKELESMAVYREQIINETIQISEAVIDAAGALVTYLDIQDAKLKDSLALAQGISGSMKGVFEKDSAAYKAFAIIEASIATYLAATKALATLPVPINYIAAAAVTAAGLANVAKISGFEEGGLVPGGEKIIRINESGQEFVVNAQATKQNKSLLEHINDGGTAEAFINKTATLTQNINMQRLEQLQSENNYLLRMNNKLTESSKTEIYDKRIIEIKDNRKPTIQKAALSWR